MGARHPARCGAGRPVLISTAAAIAPTSRIATPHPVATEKPWTRAAARGPAYAAVALIAIELRRGGPSQPPICCAGFTVAEATPRSRGAIPGVAGLKPEPL